MSSACIAAVAEGGEPRPIPNASGNLVTPTIVGYAQASPGSKNLEPTTLVGDEALKLAETSPDAVCRLADCDLNDSSWRFKYAGHEFSARAITATIINSLVEMAELHDLIVENIVLSVPANFPATHSNLFTQAAQDVGLKVLDVITDATAATIGNPIDEQRDPGEDQALLIYDLGGTSFQATLIDITDGEISTAGSATLPVGGRDWDALVVEYLAYEFARATCCPQDILETTQSRLIFVDAEKAKRQLTESVVVDVAISYDNFTETVTLSRDTFDRLTLRPLFDTIGATKRMLRDVAITQQIEDLVEAGQSRANAEDTVYSQVEGSAGDYLETVQKNGFAKFDQVLFIGGGSLMPSVQHRIAQAFGVPCCIAQPDQMIALGVALHAQDFAPSTNDVDSSSRHTEVQNPKPEDSPAAKGAEVFGEFDDSSFGDDAVVETTLSDVFDDIAVEQTGSKPVPQAPVDPTVQQAIEFSSEVGERCSVEYDNKLAKIWEHVELSDGVHPTLIQRVTAAKERLASLRQLPDAIHRADQGLCQESELATLAAPLLKEPHYEYELKTRIELARELTVQEPNEERLSEFWKELGRSKQKPKYAETDRRCLLAMHRDALLKRFHKIERIGDKAQQDRAWVEHWDEKLLQGCKAADGYRERVKLAKQRLTR